MDKKVCVRDYTNQKKEIVIRNFEDVEKIVVAVFSGDEVLNITYKNDNSMTSLYNSDDRMTSYYDGSYNLPLEYIDLFSNFNGSSYDLMEIADFDEWEKLKEGIRG